MYWPIPLKDILKPKYERTEMPSPRDRTETQWSHQTLRTCVWNTSGGKLSASEWSAKHHTLGKFAMSRFLRGPHLKNKECENDDTCYVEDYSWIYPYITILCKYIIHWAWKTEYKIQWNLRTRDTMRQTICCLLGGRLYLGGKKIN